MVSRAFASGDIRLVYMYGFGVKYFKGMLRLDVAQEIWAKWVSNEFQVIGLLFEIASTKIGQIFEQLWRELVLTNEQKSSDIKRIERYGDLMGTDFNLSLELNAEVWKLVPSEITQSVFDIFDGLHQSVYFTVYGRKWTQ